VEKRLRKGCPLSPLMFLLVAKGLSRLIHMVVESKNLRVISIGTSFYISHLLFVDDILIFCDGNFIFLNTLKEFLQIFYKSTRMIINKDKSSLFVWGLLDIEKKSISQLLDIQALEVENVMKYLGFTLKSNGYFKNV
jgi:hypothetical protein